MMLLPYFHIPTEKKCCWIKEIIYSTLNENIVSYSVYKKWFQNFWDENIDL